MPKDVVASIMIKEHRRICRDVADVVFVGWLGECEPQRHTGGIGNI